MKTDVIRSFFILAVGFAGGIIAANFPLATAATLENHNDLEKKRFWVSIDEIQQNFVFGEEFVGSYSRTVTLSDGSVRTIELTPMIHKGRKVVAMPVPVNSNVRAQQSATRRSSAIS